MSLYYAEIKNISSQAFRKTQYSCNSIDGGGSSYIRIDASKVLQRNGKAGDGFLSFLRFQLTFGFSGQILFTECEYAKP